MSNQKLYEEREGTKLKKGYMFTKYRQSRNLQGIKVNPLLGDDLQQQGVPGITYPQSRNRDNTDQDKVLDGMFCENNSDSDLEMHKTFHVNENFEITQDGLIGGVFNDAKLSEGGFTATVLGQKDSILCTQQDGAMTMQLTDTNLINEELFAGDNFSLKNKNIDNGKLSIEVKDEMEKSVSISEWCLIILITFIPFVNVLTLLAFAFLPKVNKNLKNFSMSLLICGAVFVLVATFLLTLASLMFPESILFKYKYFI